MNIHLRNPRGFSDTKGRAGDLCPGDIRSKDHPVAGFTTELRGNGHDLCARLHRTREAEADRSGGARCLRESRFSSMG